MKIASIKDYLQSNWETMQFEVLEIHFITREGLNDKWKIHTSIPLV